MRSSILSLALVCSIPFAAACTGGGDKMSPADFINDFGDTYCGTAFECRESFPTNLGATHTQIFGADVAACKAQLITGTQIQASVDAGRVTFSESAASTCISKLAALDCAGFWAGLTGDTLPTECDMATDGTVANGGVCTINLDCVSASCNGETCNAPEASGSPIEHNELSNVR
jgi:hypothetical protein